MSFQLLHIIKKEAYDGIRDLAVEKPARSGENEIDPDTW